MAFQDVRTPAPPAGTKIYENADPATGAQNVAVVGGTPATPRIAVVSTSYDSSHVIKASAGVHYSSTFRVIAAAPTGVYFAQFLVGTATLPSNGAVTMLHGPQELVHTLGTSTVGNIDDEPAGVAFPIGLVVALSTTELTLTLAGAYMLVDVSIL